MPVLDWFWNFADRHKERIPRSDWPDFASEYWGVVWVGALVKHGVVVGVADDASVALAMNPPKFLPDQLPAFIESVKTVWAMAEVADGAVNYAAIQAQYRTCEFCYGMGMVSRRAMRQDGETRGITLYCVCPAGRWLKTEHAKHDGDADKTLKGRFLDLASYPRLKQPEIADGHVIEHARGLMAASLDQVYGSIKTRAAPAAVKRHAWSTGQVHPNVPAAMPKPQPEPEQQTGTDDIPF